jgi:hypothetical protein
MSQTDWTTKTATTTIPPMTHMVSETKSTLDSTLSINPSLRAGHINADLAQLQRTPRTLSLIPTTSISAVWRQSIWRHGTLTQGMLDWGRPAQNR